MAALKRSKTNNKFFQDIPQPAVAPAEEALIILKKKYLLKDERTELVARRRDIGKKIYNLSQQITQLELKADKLLMDKVLNERVN